MTMKIWCLESNKLTSLLLWRIDTDKFRVVQYDSTAALLTNVDYVLMDKKFKPTLDGLAGQIETQDVVIYDNVRNLTWDNYFEVRILNEINPETIKQLDSKGLKIWTYGNQAVFVSEDLKTEINNIGTDEFEFSEGFSHFG
jgi:hypothetical protein